MFAEHENDEFERHLSNAGACNKLLALLRQHHPECSPPNITKPACKAVATPEPPKVESVPAAPTVVPPMEPPFDLGMSRNPVRIIARSASLHFRMPLAELLSDGRSAGAVRARHVVMYLARTMTARSLPWIGTQLGGRDHSTIWHGIDKVRSRIATDQALSDDVAAVRELAIAADPALGALA